MEIFDTKSKVKGLGIRSTRDFSIGDAVVTENPLIFTSKFGCCSWCLIPLQKKALRCSRCKFSAYCSRECQIQDFKNFHRQECPLFCEFQNDGKNSNLREYLTPTVRMAVRLFILKNDPKRNSTYEKFQNLCGVNMMQHLKSDTLELYAQISMSVILFMKHDPKNLSLRNEMMENICRLKNNTFQISFEVINNVGIGVFETGARFNHSCVSNCVQTFRKTRHGPPTLVIKSLSKIQNGSELTLKYCDVIQPKQKRQKELEENYAFLCQCQRCFYDKEIEKVATCVLESGKKEQVEKSRVMYQEYLETYKSLSETKQRRPEELTKIRTKCFHILQKVDVIQKSNLGECNTQRYHTLASLFRMALDLQKFDEALEICEVLVKLMGKYLLPTEPLLLHQRVMFVKLAWYKGLEKRTMEEIPKLQNQIYKFFDPKSEIVEELNCIVQQLYQMKQY